MNLFPSNRFFPFFFLSCYTIMEPYLICAEVSHFVLTLRILCLFNFKNPDFALIDILALHSLTRRQPTMNGIKVSAEIITIDPISISTGTSKSSEAVCPKYGPALGRKCEEDQWVVSTRDPLPMTEVLVSEGWTVSATMPEVPETEVIQIFT